MPITLHDRAPLEKVRRLADGRIAAVAKFARTGCQTYLGSEVGRPDLPTVTVYRPPSEVFDQAAMASFAHKAITVGHPANAVTADNWREHSVGWTEGKIARDGECVEIPLMLADAAAVQAYESGTARELSAGYQCDLDWTRGTTPEGQAYDAIQRTIRGNHIALVPQGRAGTECRIGDAKAASIETAWREYVAAHNLNLGGHPSDTAHHFKKFAELFAAENGSNELLSLGGYSAGKDDTMNDSSIAHAVAATKAVLDRNAAAQEQSDAQARAHTEHLRRVRYLGDHAPAFNPAAMPAAQPKAPTAFARPGPIVTDSAPSADIEAARRARNYRVATDHRR